MNETHELTLPPLPKIASKLWQECERSNDCMPILFEFYKHTGVVGITCAQITPDSPAVRPMPKLHYAILTGLLNRCCRLILANLKLSQDGLFAETTVLVDRCIIESSIRVRWLCLKKNEAAFKCYLSDGLRKDLFLLKELRRRIKARDGIPIVVEKRMIGWYARLFRAAGLTEEEVEKHPKLPNFEVLCRDLQLGEAFYTVIQRLGSHPIHGSWTDLMRFYLKWDDEECFSLRDQNARPNEDQFTVVPLIFLAALKDFLLFIAHDPSDMQDLVKHIQAIEAEVHRIHGVFCHTDFERTKHLTPDESSESSDEPRATV